MKSCSEAALQWILPCSPPTLNLHDLEQQLMGEQDVAAAPADDRLLSRFHWLIYHMAKALHLCPFFFSIGLSHCLLRPLQPGCFETNRLSTNAKPHQYPGQGVFCMRPSHAMHPFHSLADVNHPDIGNFQNTPHTKIGMTKHCRDTRTV